MLHAAFSIINYKFDQVTLDMTNINSHDYTIEFNSSGEFDASDCIYTLTFFVQVFSGDSKDNLILKLRCISQFKMENVPSISEIPEFFYRNAIAILFPYVRAYISLITTQANVNGIILPTYNLTSLEEGLRLNTKAK